MRPIEGDSGLGSSFVSGLGFRAHVPRLAWSGLPGVEMQVNSSPGTGLQPDPSMNLSPKPYLKNQGDLVDSQQVA